MMRYMSQIAFSFLFLLLQISMLASSEPVEPLNSSDSMQWQHLGVEFFESGNYTEAIRCYSMTISLEPRAAFAMNYRGVAFNELGMYDDAIRSFEEAIALDPQNNVFWTNKGNSFYDEGNFNEAIKCYEVAITLDPIFGASDAWEGRGRALAALGRFEEVSKNYQDNIKALDEALQSGKISNIDYRCEHPNYQEIQGGHDINLSPDPEKVLVGPYTVSFDMGTINHTIDVYEGRNKAFYVVKIFLPNDCWNYCENTNGVIQIKIDFNPLDKPSLFDYDLGKINWTQIKNPKEIDGLPGWIAVANVSRGVCVHAEYSLDARGNTATGNVSIDAISAFRRYWDGSGLKGNSTIPNIMRLIDTLHITKKTVTKTTYTRVPLYVEIPENTYVTE